MALIVVTEDNTFEQWRVKTNAISSFVGDQALLTTASSVIVDAINEIRSGNIEGTLTTTSGIFRVQVDNPDTFELVLNANGDLSVTGQMTASQFNGPLVGNVTGNISGNAGSATILQTTRTISLTGDASWSVSFNGSGNATGALTLANTGVTAGTYTKVTVDTKGRITAATLLSSSDVTNALGYTPLVNTGKAVDSSLLNGLVQTSNATANTIMARDASGNAAINLLFGTATSARYADLAEKYTTDNEYPVGTVIAIANSDIQEEATASTTYGQLCVGVISENPAYLMNSDSNGQPIALKGRVPVRVVGTIIKGQPICASDVVGCATYGQVNSIGVALETNLDLDEKLVECFIR